jgi:hypothetical protein
MASAECLVCCQRVDDPDALVEVSTCPHTRIACASCVAAFRRPLCPMCRAPYSEAMMTAVRAQVADAKVAAYAREAVKVMERLEDQGWWCHDTLAPLPCRDIADEVEWVAGGGVDGTGEWKLAPWGSIGRPTLFVELANGLTKARANIRTADIMGSTVVRKPRTASEEDEELLAVLQAAFG